MEENEGEYYKDRIRFIEQEVDNSHENVENILQLEENYVSQKNSLDGNLAENPNNLKIITSEVKSNKEREDNKNDFSYLKVFQAKIRDSRKNLSGNLNENYDNESNYSKDDDSFSEYDKDQKRKKLKRFYKQPRSIGFSYKKLDFEKNDCLNKRGMIFQEIKKNSQEKRKIIFNKIRIDILIKFTLYVTSNVINVLAVLNYIIQTFFDDSPENEDINLYLTYIELSFTFYFLFEYILLFYRLKGGYVKYILKIDSFIDLITILPSIITYFISFRGIKLSFIRVFRIFRVFRILRIYKSLRMIQNENFSETNKEDQQNNKLTKYDPIKLQFITIVVILICVFFIGAGLVLGINDLVDNAFTLKKFNFFDATYFMIVTYCTVGYGDILPTNIITRFLILTGLFCLFVIVSDQLTHLANLLKFWGPGLKHFNGKNHIIIHADKTMNISLFLKILTNKLNEKTQYIVISKDIEKFPPNAIEFKKAILINREDIDMDLLDLVNFRYAKAIFLFSTKSNYNYERYDKISDFFLMKITQNYYNTPPIYLQTLYSEKIVNQQNLFPRINKYEDKNVKSLKKVISIWKIKSLILSKSTFNPGFLTFIQNLMFNDFKFPMNIENHSIILQNYMRGCQNKIHLCQLPKFFNGKNFYDAMYIIYFKSINDYFVKVSIDNHQNNRPILLLGIYETNKFNIVDNNSIEIFPNDYLINDNTDGIFITDNSDSELTNILNFFNEEYRDRVTKKLNNWSFNRNDMSNDYFSDMSLNNRSKILIKSDEVNHNKSISNIEGSKDKEIFFNLFDKEKQNNLNFNEKNTSFNKSFRNENDCYNKIFINTGNHLSTKNFIENEDTSTTNPESIRKFRNKSNFKTRNIIKPKKILPRSDLLHSNICLTNKEILEEENENLIDHTIHSKFLVKKKSNSFILRQIINTNLEKNINALGKFPDNQKENLLKPRKFSQEISNKKHVVKFLYQEENLFHRKFETLEKNKFQFNPSQIDQIISNKLSGEYMREDEQTPSDSDLKELDGLFDKNLQSTKNVFYNKDQTKDNFICDRVHHITPEYRRSNSIPQNENKTRTQKFSSNVQIINVLPNSELKNIERFETSPINYTENNGKLFNLQKNENYTKSNENTYSNIKLRNIKVSLTLKDDEGEKKNNDLFSIKRSQTCFPQSKVTNQYFKVVEKNEKFLLNKSFSININKKKNFVKFQPDDKIPYQMIGSNTTCENKIKSSQTSKNDTNIKGEINTIMLNAIKEPFKNSDINNMKQTNFKNGQYLSDSIIRSSHVFLNLYELGFVHENNFINKNTVNNLEFINVGEDNINPIISQKNITNQILDNKAVKFYYNLKDDDLRKKNSNELKKRENAKNIEFNIFEIEKDDLSKRFRNHIIIIGYQDILSKLLKIFFLHHNKDICIISSPDSDEVSILKLLRQYKNLFYFKGSPENPFHLLNAGLNDAHLVVFLNEKLFGKTNEDMHKILIYKSIDYFFNTRMILELWNSKSCRLIGNVPLLDNGVVETNEFLHPSFMAGRLIYLSHLESVTAKALTEPKSTDVWMNLLSLGLRTKFGDRGNQTICNDVYGTGMPIIMTLEIPEIYYEKEYYHLVNDLMKLNPPALPIGIYIQTPLDYLKINSRGKITKSKSELGKTTIDIFTSHKKQLINLEKMDKIDRSYYGNLKILRDISYNDKAIIDVVDLNYSYLPIFITNPHPEFVISSNCKIMVIYYHITDQPNKFLKSLKSSRTIGIKKYPKSYLKKESSMKDDLRKKQDLLKEKQEKIFDVYEVLKKKLINKIERKFTQITNESKRRRLNPFKPDNQFN